MTLAYLFLPRWVALSVTLCWKGEGVQRLQRLEWNTGLGRAEDSPYYELLAPAYPPLLTEPFRPFRSIDAYDSDAIITAGDPCPVGVIGLYDRRTHTAAASWVLDETFYYRMLMISTLMLPNTIIIIPRYILFRNLGWLNTYLPFIVPAIFACYPFFIFMLVQFIRGLPRELDESAIMDGCSSMGILVRILVPLCKPALFSVGLFQFMWTWNDFFNSLIYINSVKKYTVSLGLRMTLDTQSVINWNQIMAMSSLTMVPCIWLFFFAQKYFVEGIATSGLKG